ncbi:MAG: UDP-N-acetylglucosamine 2-epimerase [Pseudomonadota bacterium]
MSKPDLHVTCITTSRADYSLQRWPMKAIAAAPGMRLSIIAGGGHVAASQGMTADEIRGDGFEINESVPMYLDTSAESGPATGAGLATIGVAQALSRLNPDWVLLLGDRFEVLGAATAAALLRLPICHLCGGDVTEGAYDDAFRHAITKLSHLHCPSTSDAAARLRHLGEEPWRISTTGSPGLDALHQVEPMSRADIFANLGLSPDIETVLVTYHPTTLKGDLGKAEFEALTSALTDRPDVQVVFTGVNADTGGATINQMAQDYVAARKGAVFRQSLGQTLYFNTVREMRMVIGNSSSGLYEVPSLGLPTINIGDRQKGRLRAASVFDCRSEAQDINRAIAAAWDYDASKVENPYGDGRSADRILKALQQVHAEKSRDEILLKRFVSLGQENPE